MMVLLLLACASKPASSVTDPDDGAPATADSAAAPTDGTWRSALYPEDWTPEHTHSDGGFLHDFSYAGYRRSEEPVPASWPGDTFDVTAYGASADLADNTAAFQAAIDAASAAGGGRVHVPDGDWRLLGTITVATSGVAIAGQSRAGTRLSFAAAEPESIRFVGAPASEAGGVPLVEDGAARSHDVRISDPSAFSVGDDVLVDWEITQAFIDAHGMGGVWDVGANSALGHRKVFFRREIVAIEADVVTLDVPLRYPALVRDAAAIRRDTGAIADCGLATLSVANAVELQTALASPRTHAIGFTRVKDCFVRDVGTWDPPEEPGSDHLRSGGVAVVESKRVTVADTAMAHAQHHGEGGAGYAFEASMSNEILFVDSTAEDVRHGFIQNWDFGASGLVFLRCAAIDDTALNSGFLIPGRSEMHHRLAIASLFDSTRDTAGFASYNRGGESSNAGHAGTEIVFWNVSGAGPDTRLSSYQVGRGYVIGTADLTALGVPDLLDAALGAAVATDPVDWIEGVDLAGSLIPASIFEDQLSRRLGQ